MAAEDVPEAPSRSTGIGAKLSKKLGPLPVWAWGLAGVSLAYLGYRYWSSKQAAASTSTAATAVGAGTSATGAPTDTSGGGGYSDGGGGQLSTLLQQLQTQMATGTPATSTNYSAFPTLAAALSAAQSGTPVYEETAPGVFTAYSGGIPGIEAAIKNKWGGTFYAPTNGAVAGVSGAAAPTTTTSEAPSPVSTPAAAAAATTPSPAISPVTSGGSLGGTPTTGPTIGPTAPAVAPAASGNYVTTVNGGPTTATQLAEGKTLAPSGPLV